MHEDEQLRAATASLRGILGDGLLAVYLHGSAVSGGLRPQSDVDLLAVVDRDLTDPQRDALLAALLDLSGRHPRVPGAPRCLEVMVFRRADLAAPAFPARAEFVYGEWLREGFAAGERPLPASDPEYTLLLAQAGREAVALFGPGAAGLLPDVGADHVRRAMREALPALLAALPGDERNVLLTLARMWRTADTGDFVPKDAAALWAIPRIPDRDASTLDYARRAYRGEIADDWSRRGDAARRLALHLRDRLGPSL